MSLTRLKFAYLSCLAKLQSETLHSGGTYWMCCSRGKKQQGYGRHLAAVFKSTGGGKTFEFPGWRLLRRAD